MTGAAFTLALGNPPHPSSMWGSGSVGAPWLDFCDAHTAQGRGPSLAGPHAEARDLKRGPGRPPHATGRVKDREDAGPVAEHVLYACRWVVTAHEEGRGFHPTVVRRLWKARAARPLWKPRLAITQHGVREAPDGPLISVWRRGLCAHRTATAASRD